jgi:hypothetical protein
VLFSVGVSFFVNAVVNEQNLRYWFKENLEINSEFRDSGAV